MEKLDPAALATCGDDDLDTRERVQPVDAYMIEEYVTDAEELPAASAHPFAEWINAVWNDFNEDGDKTNGDVIAGALAHWRGQ